MSDTCSACRFYEEHEFEHDVTQPQWSCIADYVPETVRRICCYEPVDVPTRSDRPACRRFERLEG